MWVDRDLLHLDSYCFPYEGVSMDTCTAFSRQTDQAQYSTKCTVTEAQAPQLVSMSTKRSLTAASHHERVFSQPCSMTVPAPLCTPAGRCTYSIILMHQWVDLCSVRHLHALRLSQVMISAEVWHNYNPASLVKATHQACNILSHLSSCFIHSTITFSMQAYTRAIQYSVLVVENCCSSKAKCSQKQDGFLGAYMHVQSSTCCAPVAGFCIM